MNNEANLIPSFKQILFKFNQQNSSYQSILPLLNASKQSIFFKITSTFGKLLSHQDIQFKKIQPNKTVIIQLKLKIPNQIKKTSQRIIVSYSNKQISQKIKIPCDKEFTIKISFQQNLPDEDQVISQILILDCNQLYQEASQLFKLGQVKKALYKYEESFLLFRQFDKGVYGMSECFYLMQSWIQSSQAIETALIFNKNSNYLWLRAKILYEIYKDQSIDIQLIRNLKKEINQLPYLANTEEKKTQIMNFLIQQQKKITETKGGKLMYEFVEKALTMYETDNKLKDVYKDKNLYERQLHEVLKIGSTHSMEQTPQYVLDPISYQIMGDPLIAPSGHSFERNSLLSYLQKHGNKDLYTRQELRYEWCRPNLALQKYIKSSQKLISWMNYQTQITSFK